MDLAVLEVIRKKREGLQLSTEEIKYFVDAVVKGKINECQTGAMLMAIFLQKLDNREITDLTKAMIDSGDILKYNKFRKDDLVDKHSTGGVGDKVSLVLAPALAACGLKVPMISGRSLGYTGGTLDKLESIPGFQVDLTLDRMNLCLEKVGCFICGTTKSLVPADAILYTIRDITATVETPSLIVPSILSKKAAEGIGTLVIDVTFGKGSPIKSEEEARALAKILVGVGSELKINTQAVISEMNAPLGRFVGNALEVVESIMCLTNQLDNAVSELVKLLGGIILHVKGLAKSLEEGKFAIADTLKNQTALNCFSQMLIEQGVSEENARDLCEGNFWKVLPKAAYITRMLSPSKGVVTGIDALKIGKACWYLGGGRTEAETRIDHSVGVVLLKEIGSHVEETEPWIEVHHSTSKLSSNVEELIKGSLRVDGTPTILRPTIKTVVL